MKNAAMRSFNILDSYSILFVSKYKAREKEKSYAYNMKYFMLWLTMR